MPNILHGTVTKTGAMAKTITVTLTRSFEHPRFFKRLERTKKMLVHDENANAKLGDRVSILHTKPFSKRKHFRLSAIDGRPVGPVEGEGEGEAAPSPTRGSTLGPVAAAVRGSSPLGGVRGSATASAMA